MRYLLFVLLIVSSLYFVEDTKFNEQVELQITNLSINPKPEYIDSKIKLKMSMSYRFEVTIKRGGPGHLSNPTCFTVRTECVGKNHKVNLGEVRVGIAPNSGWNIYAVYDVFPASAGEGDFLLQTTVDADNEIQELDESAISNVWELKTIIVQ